MPGVGPFLAATVCHARPLSSISARSQLASWSAPLALSYMMTSEAHRRPLPPRTLTLLCACLPADFFALQHYSTILVSARPDTEADEVSSDAPPLLDIGRSASFCPPLPFLPFRTRDSRDIHTQTTSSYTLRAPLHTHSAHPTPPSLIRQVSTTTRPLATMPCPARARTSSGGTWPPSASTSFSAGSIGGTSQAAASWSPRMATQSMSPPPMLRGMIAGESAI